jgi:hypothetical protein
MRNINEGSNASARDAIVIKNGNAVTCNEDSLATLKTKLTLRSRHWHTSRSRFLHGQFIDWNEVAVAEHRKGRFLSFRRGSRKVLNWRGLKQRASSNIADYIRHDRS